MALKVPQSSFAKGELDPILHERTTLQAFQVGLATGRNGIIGKTGSAFSRPGRTFFKETKTDDEEVVGFSPPGSGYLLEFGHQYVRIYNLVGTLVADVATVYTRSMLSSLHFDVSGNFVYTFCNGWFTTKLNYTTGVFSTGIFDAPTFGAGVTVTPGATAPTGYALDYAVTYVKDGQESLPYAVAAGSAPINTGELNTVDINIAPVGITGVTEIRVYRRPQGGGVYGFVGSSSNIFNSGGNVHGSFTDLGASADYSHNPPRDVHTEPPAAIPINYFSKTGVIYQQRLLITDPDDLEAIFASRPGFHNNFMRDYPLNNDSALKFKSGASGFARVLRMLEADGLVVFTSIGVFLNAGALGAANLALAKKGKWIIKESIPPLAVPGGVFFVDAATNTLRNLVWSEQLAGYNGQELSIFSNHLFANRGVTSWAFQEGVLPLLWVTFDDGTYASFTYEFDHEMKAWMRHDSVTDVEQVVGTGLAEKTYFLVKNGTKRYWEVTNPRFIPASLFAVDPESDKNPSIAYMDSIKSFARLLNNSLAGADEFLLEPITPEDWGGELTMTCGTSAIFTAAGAGKVGEIFRIFDEDRSEIDLEVLVRASDDSITVKCTNLEAFPEYLKTNPRVYWTMVHLTGLTHLANEIVSVISDGEVVASPNNDIENYDDHVVDSGGEMTLAERHRGAIIHVGRPVPAGDIETLDITTVEQAPTLIESLTVNKLYIKTLESFGGYIGHKFPPNDKVNRTAEVMAMSALDLETHVDFTQENPVIGNRYKQPEGKRYEVSLPGDWASNGRIAIRFVDPLHWHILSIIPDVEVEKRSDRG
jgi:hypothetical protein